MCAIKRYNRFLFGIIKNQPTALFSLLMLMSLTLPAQAEYTLSGFELHPLSQISPESLEQPSEAAPTSFQALPVITLAQHQVLDNLKGTFVTLLNASPGEPIAFTLMLNNKEIHRASFQGGAALRLPDLPLPPGRHELLFRFERKNQPLLEQKVTVFYLGEKPYWNAKPAAHYVLVDKYNFTLYYIENQRLVRIYPIAIGRPRTPTPTGLFIMAKKEVMPNPHTAWGVRRLLIYTPSGYLKKHWSGYALHGTNNPASIGTEASHGCVRMFNEDVTELFKLIPLHTPVIIREKLPVFFEKL